MDSLQKARKKNISVFHPLIFISTFHTESDTEDKCHFYDKIEELVISIRRRILAQVHTMNLQCNEFPAFLKCAENNLLIFKLISNNNGICFAH